MPFLKFTRDRRGYEHFQLVEPLAARRGKTRQRLLYWFRSPPNVKVGREPFDQEVRRALEAQNPGVRFDWDKLRNTPIPSAEPEYWRERRRAERAARQAQGEDETESAAAEVPAGAALGESGGSGETGGSGELGGSGESVGLDAPVAGVEPVAETISAGPTTGATSATGRRRRRRRRRGSRRPELAAAGALGSGGQTERTEQTSTDQASVESNEPAQDSSHDEPEGI